MKKRSAKIIQGQRQTQFMHRSNLDNLKMDYFQPCNPQNLQVWNTWTISKSGEFEGWTILSLGLGTFRGIVT